MCGRETSADLSGAACHIATIRATDIVIWKREKCRFASSEARNPFDGHGTLNVRLADHYKESAQDA
jgi:hypothetical protein